MKDIAKHELKYGPHFNEECSIMAVSKMKNEDGTTGAHWTIDQTTDVAKLYNVNLMTGHFNKYDWFVALNMVYSDYYHVIYMITGTDDVKYFVDLAKAWLMDKDIDEGKMWYYYKYVMCDKYRKMHEEGEDDDYEDYDHYPREHFRKKHKREYYYSYPEEDDEYEDEDEDEDRHYNRKKAFLYRGRYISRY